MMAAETETTPVNEDNSFSDWHFVKAPKGTEITDLSDDDSIEILEREVEKPTTPFCSSDEEVETEVGELESQPLENEVSEPSPESSEDSVQESISNYISDFFSYVEFLVDSIQNDLLSWKCIYFFIVLSLVSFAVREYRDYVAVERMATELETHDLVSILFSMPNEFVEESIWSKAKHVPHEMEARIHRNINYAKAAMAPIFADSSDILKCIKLFKHNVYIVNVYELQRTLFLQYTSTMLKSKLLYHLQNAVENVPICVSADVANYELPYMCTDTEDFLLFLKDTHLVHISHSVGKFYKDYSSKFNDLGESIIYGLTKHSELNRAKLNHYGFYESNEFCVKTPPASHRRVRVSSKAPRKDSTGTPEISPPEPATEPSPPVPEPIATPTKSEDSVNTDVKLEKLTEEIKILMKQFHEEIKDIKEQTALVAAMTEKQVETAKCRDQALDGTTVTIDGIPYQLEKEQILNESSAIMDVESVMMDVDANSFIIELEDVPEDLNAEPEEANTGFIYNTKPITERWLFKLFAEKPEYENNGKELNGDWILKLNKGRESLRKENYKKEKKRERESRKKHHDKTFKKSEYFKQYKEWFKKKREEVKKDYKNFQLNVKHKIKRIKDNIRRNYEKIFSSNWEFDMRNMFPKWRF